MELPTLDKFPRAVLGQIDVQRTFIISRVIVAAERLQLFRVLHGKRMKSVSIGRSLKIHKACRDAFLNSLAAVGLLHKAGDTYWNTRLADKYFVDERSIYWTRQYSKECVEAYDRLTVLEKALATGRSWASIKRHKKPSYTEAMKRDWRRAEDFTQMLFHFHRNDALEVAKFLDLSKRRALLDVGGGSGVMSIAVASRNPRLHACVLDIAPVCKIAAGNIQRAGLSRRIRTQPGDFEGKWPAGYDVIMFCDIGPVSQALLKSAYKRLPPGGLIVGVDRYLSDDRTKPFDRVVAQLLGSSFPRVTRSEMVTAIKACGFQSVRAKNVCSDLWMITGTKPTTARPASRKCTCS
jgi:SAM-dependent methyltransferase